MTAVAGGGACGWGAGTGGAAAGVGVVRASTRGGAEEGGVSWGGGVTQAAAHSGSDRAYATITARTPAIRLPAVGLFAIAAPQSRPGTSVD